MPISNDKLLEILLDRFNSIDGRFDNVDKRLDGIDNRLDNIEKRLFRSENEIKEVGKQLNLQNLQMEFHRELADEKFVTKDYLKGFTKK